MFTYTRRLLTAITVLLISLAIFMLLELAPGDPYGRCAFTISPEVKAKMRGGPGAGPAVVGALPAWLEAVFWVRTAHLSEPLVWLPFPPTAHGGVSGRPARCQELIIQRLPQTLWVVGMGHVVGVSMAIPIGVISAYKQLQLVRPDRRLHFPWWGFGTQPFSPA